MTTPAIQRARARLEQAVRQVEATLAHKTVQRGVLDFDLAELARVATESRVEIAGERQ